MAKFIWNPAKDEAGDIIEGAVEANFQAKLVNFIKNADGSVKSYTSNSTGKTYHTAVIEFDGPNGKQRGFARVYEGNLTHGMTEGETYASTVRVSEEYPQPFVTMSHLQGGGAVLGRDAFGLEAVVVEGQFGRND